MIRIYTRVSTEEQAQEGFSLDAQRRSCLAYCTAQAVADEGWNQHQFYVDDGISGKDMHRPALRQLLGDLAPGDTLLVYKLDRLTRSVGDLHALLQKSATASWSLRSVTEALDTSSATGRAMIHLIGVFAQWERETIAERMRMGKVQRALSGKRVGGRSNLGLVIRGGVAALDPNTAPVVADIYRWYLEGLGVQAITARLNAAGIATATGGRWRPATVHKILRNPIYAGDLRYGEVHLPDAFPALIPRADWDRVQLRLSRGGGWQTRRSDNAAPLLSPSGTPAIRIPARARGSRYLLTGLLRCGACGSPMVGVPRGRLRADGTRACAYACSGHLQQRSCLARTQAPTQRVDDEVLAVLATLLGDLSTTDGGADPTPGPGSAADGAAGRARDLQVATAGLATLHRKRERAWAAYLAGDISLERWRAHEGEFRTQLVRLEHEQARLRLGPDPGDAARQSRIAGLAALLPELMRHPGVPSVQKKAWLHEHIATIYLRTTRAWPTDIRVVLV